MGTTVFKASVILTLLYGSTAFGQGTLAEYKKAVAVDSLFKDKVFNFPTGFHWADETTCWYVNPTAKGREYLLVDAGKRAQSVAFDHEKLAGSLSIFLDRKIAPYKMSLDSLHFDPGKGTFTFLVDSLKLLCDLGSYSLTKLPTLTKAKDNERYWGGRFDEMGNGPVSSPDSVHIAYIKNHNLYMKSPQEGEVQLSYDGSKGFFYSSYLQWSPDGKKIMAYKVRPGEEHTIYFVESSPQDQLQPKLQSREYLKPGDQLPFKSPQLFSITEKKQLPISTQLFPEQYSLSNMEWRKDSSSFTMEYNQRGHQLYRVLEMDATSGQVKVLIEERSPTFIDYSSKRYRYDLENRDIIWMSERDGWNRLYLYDGHTGKVKHPITKGEWPVRKVLHVDGKKRQIYFTASGMDREQDPYLLHYCRIDFDGKNLVRFTTENGNHKITFSPDYRFYVDQYSRVDLPPISLLKGAEDQKTLLQLQKADISALVATGWRSPEVFSAKGRDGVTDIWGIIVRPTTFDLKRNYPIIEYIYAGPHDSFVPKSFFAQHWALSSLAELGFIVVQIDGMGTSNRSKVFHDVCWKNLKDAGFPDRKLWMTAASKKYPYMDIGKVGIHGTSAGGQNAGAALVFNSDFYDVAVASCGCHDNRMDKIWWNEQWMGYPVGPEYAACSNVENAALMEGNLMLILGEVDDNVDPASTMQFANALIKANKDFELVTIPGMGHSAGGSYGERKRRDYFVRHLMGVAPPSWEEIYNE